MKNNNWEIKKEVLALHILLSGSASWLSAFQFKPHLTDLNNVFLCKNESIIYCLVHFFFLIKLQGVWTEIHL